MACSRIWDQQMQCINPKIGRVNGPARKSALLSQNCGLHRFNLPSLHNPAFWISVPLLKKCDAILGEQSSKSGKTQNWQQLGGCQTQWPLEQSWGADIVLPWQPVGGSKWRRDSISEDWDLRESWTLLFLELCRFGNVGGKGRHKGGAITVSFPRCYCSVGEGKRLFKKKKISTFDRKHPASCVLMSCLASRSLDNPPPSWTGGSSYTLSSTSPCFLITVVGEGYTIQQKDCS